MKIWKTLLALPLVLTLACSSDDDGEGAPPANTVLEIVKSELDPSGKVPFLAEVTDGVVDIRTNYANWRAEFGDKSLKWCKVEPVKNESPANGVVVINQLKITMDENEGKAPREAVVKLFAGNKEISRLKIKQLGVLEEDLFIIVRNGESILLAAQENTLSLDIEANIGYYLSFVDDYESGNSIDWIKVHEPKEEEPEDVTRADGDVKTVKFDITPNPSDTQREGVIVIEAEGHAVDRVLFKVTQTGRSEALLTLISPESPIELSAMNTNPAIQTQSVSITLRTSAEVVSEVSYDALPNWIVPNTDTVGGEATIPVYFESPGIITFLFNVKNNADQEEARDHTFKFSLAGANDVSLKISQDGTPQ